MDVQCHVMCFVAPMAGISSDTPCMDCGYNLRSLSPDGRCPECGREVGASLAFHDFWHQSPRLRRLRTGVFLLAASQIVWLVISPVLILIRFGSTQGADLLFWFLIVFDGPRPWVVGAVFGERPDDGMLAMAVGFLLIPTIAQIAAMWRLATPTLDGEQSRLRSYARPWLRIASIAAPALLPVMLLTNALPGPHRETVWGILVAIMLLIDMLLALLLSSRLGRIARRLNWPALGHCARIIGYGIVAADAMVMVHLGNGLLFGLRENTMLICLLGIYSLAFFSLCQLPVAILLARSLSRLGKACRAGEAGGDDSSGRPS
jgi:hypothetical protein